MDSSSSDVRLVLARLDALEKILNQRHEFTAKVINGNSLAIQMLEQRVRKVELSNARLLALVTGGGTIGGSLAIAVAVIARALGVL